MANVLLFFLFICVFIERFLVLRGTWNLNFYYSGCCFIFHFIYLFIFVIPVNGIVLAVS